jgi:hypothetical protein
MVAGGDAVAMLAVTQERFQAGDFPMVCVRSGLPADMLAPVEAGRRRRSVLPFLLLGVLPGLLWWLLAYRTVEWTWGRLPFATGQAQPITAIWSKRRHLVHLNGVHPDFVSAHQLHQAHQRA